MGVTIHELIDVIELSIATALAFDADVEPGYVHVNLEFAPGEPAVFCDALCDAPTLLAILKTAAGPRPSPLFDPKAGPPAPIAKG